MKRVTSFILCFLAQLCKQVEYTCQKSLKSFILTIYSFLYQEKAKATLEILPLDISPIYTFFEYIGGGTQIHCCFAIDYTASNGDPADPR